MKIVSVRSVRTNHAAWLQERFGDHFAQISIDTSLRLKSSAKDVSRIIHGRVLPVVEELSKKFEMPPQGVSDVDFVFGYEDSGEHVPGSIESDQNLMKYVAMFPKEWEIVQKCLGLSRQKSRHACLPASELIYTKSNGLKPIVECGGEEVYTGQGTYKKGHFQEHGRATLLKQGEREVVEYTLGNGKTLRCTPDHQVLTVQGWMEIQQVFEKGIDLAKPSTRIRLFEKDAVSYAESRGGQLVEWGGKSYAPSKWRCSQGHEWEQSFSHVFSYEYWCKSCSHSSRFKASKRYVDPKRAAGKCLSTYRRYDQKKGFDTDLTVEDVVAAKSGSCVYCDRQATGMERISNTKGHTRDNCVPACLRCNWMRGDHVTHSVMLKVGELLKGIDP